MHECQRYNGLVMRGLYRPSYHFITTLIGAARGSLIYVDTTLGGGPVARLFGWDRGPIWDWVGPWPDLGGLVARFGWARGPRFGMMCHTRTAVCLPVPTPTGAAPGRKRTSPAHPQDRTALLGLYWTAICVIRLVPTPNTISIS